MNDGDHPFTKNRSEAKGSSWRDRFRLTKLADVVPDDEPLWLIDNLIPAGPSLGVTERNQRNQSETIKKFRLAPPPKPRNPPL